MALAIVIGLWLFTFKVLSFQSLGDSLDIFLQTQIASTWLEGRPFAENFHGNHLGVHTYFMLILLGPLAKVFGSYALLFTIATAWASAVFLSTRILSLLGVPGAPGAIASIMIVLSPLSMHVFHDWQYGFHVELLEPAFALFLLYALLREHLLLSIVSLMLLLSIKEDTPQLAASIALVAIVEGRLAGRKGNRRWNCSAIVAAILAVAALPVLVGIVASNPHPPGAWGGLERLQVAWSAGVRSYSGLFAFIIAHFGEWMTSAANRAGVGVLVLASCGFALLRPQYLPLVILFTMVSWLVGDEILWAPRLAPLLAFSWSIALLGFASFWRSFSILILPLSSQARRFALMAFLAVSAVIGVRCWALSLPLLSRPYDVYSLTPWTYYTESERRDADEVFALYRSAGRPDEPVIAHIYLFRYAHDRDLYWFYRMRPGVTPKWILWDDAAPGFEKWGFSRESYRQISKKGRFSLWSLK